MGFVIHEEPGAQATGFPTVPVACAPGSQKVEMKRTRQDPWYVRWTLTLAALIVLTLLVFVPMVAVFYNALEGGLGAYWDNLVNDADTRHSILLTLAVAPTAVALNLAFGMAAAW